MNLSSVGLTNILIYLSFHLIIGQENVALRKSTYQSSVHSGLDGKFAVDGDFTQTYTGCAHGNDKVGKANWLVINLTDVYHVHHVILTPRQETESTMPNISNISNFQTQPRMDHVYIGVLNDFTKHVNRHSYPLCIQSPRKTDISQNMTLICRPNTPPGRYVIVQQPITGPGMLTVCEIQIFGKKLAEEWNCKQGYYGQNCDKLCKCNKQIDCHNVTGYCENECEDDWEGYNCNKSVNNITKLMIGCFDAEIFGQDDILTERYTTCIDQCSGFGFNYAANLNESTCYCSNYIDWSRSIFCNNCSQNDCFDDKIKVLFSVCPNGTYGYNCTLKCHCIGGCSYLNGTCYQGCQNGWMGDSCDMRNCKINNGACDTNTVCVSNSSDISSCLCNTPYFHQKNIWSPCEDIDECQMENKICKVNEICLNTIGGYNCSIKPSGKQSYVIYIIISIAVILILLVVILFVVKCIKIYKSKNKPGDLLKFDNPAFMAPVSETLEAMKVTDIYLEDMPYYVSEKKHLFAKEFQDLPTFDYSTAISQKQPKALNRFKNIVPYDNNRVKLDGCSSDYINASYIKIDQKTTLIATQGPTKLSIDNFWKMIWQENIGIVVMLCNFVEMAKVKCEEYWPMKECKSYGDIKVTFKSYYNWPEYKVTRLTVEKDGNDQRELIHFHYTKWPDHNVPDNCVYFLEFNRHFRRARDKYKCGVIVHCSAGVGRTGSFIAIVDLILKAKANKPINVSSCVSNLRKERMKMVEREVQYSFIYDCLVDEASLGETTFNPQEFRKYFTNRENIGTKLNKQYERLQSLVQKKNKFKEIGYIEVITSTLKFNYIRENNIKEFWKDLPNDCDLLIAFTDYEDCFPDCGQPIETEDKIFSFETEERKDEITKIRLKVSDKIETSNYENFNVIYENTEHLKANVGRQFDMVLVDLNKIMKMLDYNIFIQLFEMMKPNTLTSFVSQNENIAWFIMTASNIIDQIINRDEVAIFQNVLELGNNEFKYFPTIDEYEKLHDLILEYLTDNSK